MFNSKVVKIRYPTIINNQAKKRLFLTGKVKINFTWLFKLYLLLGFGTSA